MSVAVDMRRGWCPDMLHPMPTGDGLLVRLHPRGAMLSAAQACAIADGANRFGNGHLDVSSRGNIQIRGVTPASHPQLVESLISAGLMKGVRAESPYRLTTISPLAGIDPADRVDAFALAERIEQIGSSLKGLHAKFSILIDGGGAINLDGIDADLRLVALSDTRIAVGLARPDGSEWIGVLASTGLSAVVGALLGRTGGERLRDFDRSQLQRLGEGLRFESPEAPLVRPRALRAGRFESGEQQAFFLGLPYGRCEADALAKVASWSEEFGRGEIRLSPFKALVIPFMSADGCADLAPLAQAEGFIVDDNDPRLSISACVGMEGCAHGSTPTHADADRIAAASRWLQPGSSVHVSGCAKGCAHPAAADLTLVGNSGTYEVVLGGAARDKPVARVGIDTIVERLATTSSRIDLMHAFETSES